MPKTTASGRAKRGELPATLRRSPAKAQRTFAKAHDGAMESYGDERRAHRAAYAALKHSFEKVGDHWEPKAAGKGPSDPRAARSGAREEGGETYGGVDAGRSKRALYDRAKALGVRGRSQMSKRELAKAIQSTQR